jgi:hypothetical protein
MSKKMRDIKIRDEKREIKILAVEEREVEEVEKEGGGRLEEVEMMVVVMVVVGGGGEPLMRDGVEDGGGIEVEAEVEIEVGTLVEEVGLENDGFVKRGIEEEPEDGFDEERIEEDPKEGFDEESEEDFDEDEEPDKGVEEDLEKGDEEGFGEGFGEGRGGLKGREVLVEAEESEVKDDCLVVIFVLVFVLEVAVREADLDEV